MPSERPVARMSGRGGPARSGAGPRHIGRADMAAQTESATRGPAVCRTIDRRVDRSVARGVHAGCRMRKTPHSRDECAGVRVAGAAGTSRGCAGSSSPILRVSPGRSPVSVGRPRFLRVTRRATLTRKWGPKAQGLVAVEPSRERFGSIASVDASDAARNLAADGTSGPVTTRSNQIGVRWRMRWRNRPRRTRIGPSPAPTCARRRCSKSRRSWGPTRASTIAWVRFGRRRDRR
jgi:hypothetical protein